MVTALLLLGAGLAPVGAVDGFSEAVAPSVIQEYVDVTASAGLGGFLHAGFLGNSTTIARFIEIMGPGVCWLDADGDGRLDLYLVNGRYYSQPEKEAALHPTSRLYRNLGQGVFEDVSVAAGVDLSLWGQGCAVADHDNDGDPDLFVAGWGSDTFYRNDGGVFTNVTASLLPQADVCAPYSCWSAGATWFDADRDGCMDLYVSRFGNWTLDIEGPSSPEQAPAQRDQFFGGSCGGPFVDRTQAAGFNTFGHTWSAVAYDINDDVWPDLYVANDGDPNELWLNDGDDTFTLAILGAENYRSGMGAAAGDLDHDGRPDLVTTNFLQQANGIFLQQPNGTFLDVGDTAPFNDGRAWVGWATFMSDVDQDGRQDLTIINGFTEDASSIVGNSRQIAEPLLIYRQRADGTFEQVNATLGAAADARYVGRGAAWADYDDDGDLDLALGEAGENPTHLWRMDRPTGQQLTISLVGSAPGVTRDAEGARVTLSAQGIPSLSKEKRAQQGIHSSNDPRLHFGLGEAREADLLVRWPDGSTESFADVPANAFVRIVQGSPLVIEKRLPIATLAGPGVIERLVPASFESSLDRPLARAQWDFGDGGYAVCAADGICRDQTSAIVGSMNATGAVITHAFALAGPFGVGVALFDADGNVAAKRHVGTVTSKVVATLAFDEGRFEIDERARGVASARYEDGTPVPGARLTLAINFSFYPQPESILLPLTPAGVRTLVGYRTHVMEGTTDANGTWRFEVPLWTQSPIPAASAVKFNPVGDYSALVSGTYRTSVLVNATSSYQVFPALFGD